MELPLEQLAALLKPENGSGAATQVLLFLILMSIRGLKKEVRTQGETLKRVEIGHEIRIGSLESRVNGLEGKEK